MKLISLVLLITTVFALTPKFIRPTANIGGLQSYMTSQCQNYIAAGYIMFYCKDQDQGWVNFYSID